MTNTRRSVAAIAILLLLSACPGPSQPQVDSGPPPPNIDAPPGCPALPDRATFDFFGETCTAAAYPANTLCHQGDKGWCIGPMAGGVGVCRPMASDGHCPVCPSGTEQIASAGAHYCAP